MRFLIDAQALTAGIQSVIKALPLRTSMQILEGVHVVAEGGVLRLMCSDLMLEKECRLPAAIEQEGRAIIPAKLFAEVVRRLPNETASIAVDGKSVDISGIVEEHD